MLRKRTNNSKHVPKETDFNFFFGQLSKTRTEKENRTLKFHSLFLSMENQLYYQKETMDKKFEKLLEVDSLVANILQPILW